MKQFKISILEFLNLEFKILRILNWIVSSEKFSGDGAFKNVQRVIDLHGD